MLQLIEKLSSIAYSIDLGAKSRLCIAITIFLASPLPTLGDQPHEVLRQAINKGISVLENPQYQDAYQRKEQAQKLWEVTREIFDFKEFTRRALSFHWRKFTSPQREEIVQLMGIFLGKLYLYKLQSEYIGEKVLYNNQVRLIRIDKSIAWVEIKVIWKKRMVPVELRMKKIDDIWRVYNITAEGINAVESYREQFYSELQKKSPEEVIEFIKEKIRVLEKDL